MNKITVDVSKKYDVIIDGNLLDKTGEYVKNTVKSKKIAIVCDDTVENFYAERVEKSLKDVGFETVKFVIEHGEKSKCAAEYIRLVNFMAQNRITRGDCALALGGGVVGDLTGFASSTYLRGIHFIQVPTTLLAAVDSSVGGKTAIDLECGKNLAGSFYQPDLVLCDYSTLKTLPDDIFCDGSSEVIKYSVLANRDLYEHLAQYGKNFDTEYVISECVKMKRDIVKSDEFDTGKRMLLNLGHTLGHAIEAASDYKIPHGRAVAAGMAVFTKAAEKYGICGNECYGEVVDLLKKFNLPYSTDFKADVLYEIMTADKKRNGNTVTVVVPEKVGNCILKTMTLEQLKSFVKAGLE